MAMTYARGLALLRIGMGLTFIMSVFGLTTGGWLWSAEPLLAFFEKYKETTTPPYDQFLQTVVIPNAGLFAQLHGRAAAASDPLPYTGGFLLTGNYVVGSVDLQGQSANGFQTGTIHMSGVPANADILAAYLFWETIDLPGSPNLDPQATPVLFRGHGGDAPSIG